MWQKGAISILFALLLAAQLVVTLPTQSRPAKETAQEANAAETEQPAAANATASNENPPAESAWTSTQLLTVLVDEVGKHMDFVLVEQRALLERVFNDETLAGVSSASMQETRRNFTELINALNEIAHDRVAGDRTPVNILTKIVYIYSKNAASGMFHEMVECHNTTELEKPTTEDFLIENAFKRNGWDQYRRDCEKHSWARVVAFERSVDEYMSSLSAEEKRKGAELLDWCKQFKQSDVEKKLELMSQILPALLYL